MDKIIIRHVKKEPPRISVPEFNITKLFLDAFEVDCESDYTLMYKYIPLSCGDRLLGYSEFYNQLSNIPSTQMVFRPLKNEKHTNIIIDMFDDLNIIEFNNMEIKEYIKNGKKKYSGCLKNGNDVIDETFIKMAPTIPILKLSIIASVLFDIYDYDSFYENLMEFIKFKKYKKY